MLNNTSILITGGTGSFGHTFVSMTLAKYNTKNGSPNDRRKTKRALEVEFKELRDMELMMDSHLKDAYLDNISFLKEEVRRNEGI